jgi:uncharacterized protein YlxW (UPF0749 family)
MSDHIFNVGQDLVAAFNQLRYKLGKLKTNYQNAKPETLAKMDITQIKIPLTERALFTQMMGVFCMPVKEIKQTLEVKENSDAEHMKQQLRDLQDKVNEFMNENNKLKKKLKKMAEVD